VTSLSLSQSLRRNGTEEHLGNLSESASLGGRQREKQAVDRGGAGCQYASGRGVAFRGEDQRQGASVGARLALDIAHLNQPIDESNGARWREADRPAQLVHGSVAEKLVQRHQRRWAGRGSTGRRFGGVSDPIR
jgi:hypothetical protein